MPRYPNKIKSVRRKKKLTQEKLAGLLGVSLNTLQRWESGKCRPSSLALARLQETIPDAGILDKRNGGYAGLAEDHRELQADIWQIKAFLTWITRVLASLVVDIGSDKLAKEVSELTIKILSVEGEFRERFGR